MKTVCKINECSGCRACAESCPRHCINIVDSVYSINAQIDESLCIHCNQCERVCPNINKPIRTVPILFKQGWVASELRCSSSSGGAASAIIASFIQSGGYVASCLFKRGTFAFEITNDLETAKRFAGSKYVKSNPEDIYKKIRERLSTDKVLFIGLPCQVAGVLNYVGKDLQENLYTIDLICHGSPSPKILCVFLEQYNIKLSDLSDIQFRRKNNYQLKTDEKYIGTKGVMDNYSIGFLNSLFYTENCYNCQYAKLERVSDITLGDSWGTKLSQAEQKQGVSLILCQTKKGEKLLRMSNLQLYDVDPSIAIKHNHQLEHPSLKPSVRDAFFKGLTWGKNFNMLIRQSFPKQCLKQFIKELLIKIKLYDANL